jgi:hypothetical protein
MRPEVVGVFLNGGGPKVEVLQLRKREERGSYDDIYPEHLEACVVEEEGVLERELAELICVHDAGVLDNVDVLGRPAGGDEGHHDLLQHPPVPGEADEQRGPLGDVRGARGIPSWDGRKLGGRVSGEGEREVVDNGRGSVCYGGLLVDWIWRFLFLWRGEGLEERALSWVVGEAGAPREDDEDDEEQRDGSGEGISLAEAEHLLERSGERASYFKDRAGVMGEGALEDGDVLVYWESLT